MKAYIYIIAAALLAGAAGFSTKATMNRNDSNTRPDGDGHVLTALWKQYEAARKGDLPKKQIQILERIKAEASAGRYHWDYYDALTNWLSVQTSRNWKLRNSYRDSLTRDIEDYGEPVVSYVWKRECGEREQVDFVLTNRARLEAGRNEAFYYNASSVGVHMNGLLAEYIKDDFEFALWNEYVGWSDGSKVAGILADKLGNSYPSAAWLEYLETGKRVHRTSDEALQKTLWQEYADKYKGRAVSLFAKDKLLWQEFEEIQGIEDRGDTAGVCAGRYKDLYGKCKAAEKERASYSSGTDARIAGTIEGFKSLMSILESKSIEVFVKDGFICAGLRNVGKVTVEMLLDKKDAKPVLKEVLVNPRKSFFATDTVRVKIPACDDGDYFITVKASGAEGSMRYSRKSLSIAVRKDSEGWSVFVADCNTGEPAGVVDLELSTSGKKSASFSGFSIDGFTKLPPQIAGKVSRKDASYLQASRRDGDGFLRLSPGLYLLSHDWMDGSAESEDIQMCLVFTDKGAYNPGETVCFKALFYEGDPGKELRTTAAGVDVKVTLEDPEGDEVCTQKLKTNEYGSVAGSFTIPSGCRNGIFRVIAESDEAESDRSIRVDEFILPTYDVRFDKVEKLYFPGDTVRVTGKLESYSGHPLSAASAVYEVTSYRKVVSQGQVGTGGDGSFAIEFIPSDSAPYNITLKVTDSTGETKEFTKMVWIVSSFNISLSVANRSDGSVSRTNDDDVRGALTEIVSEDKAKVRFVVNSNMGETDPIPLSYELKASDGTVCKTGTVRSGDTEELPLGAPGEYVLTAKATVNSAKGAVDAETVLHIMRVPDDAASIGFKVENLFRLCGPCAGGKVRTGGNIDLLAGSTNGPVWMVVELFGDRRQLLDRRILRFEGEPGKDGSLQHVLFPCKEGYPEKMFLAVFYFHNASHHTFVRQLSVEKEEDSLPLSFSSFRDSMFPGEEYSFTLETAPWVEALAAVFDKSSETVAANRWEKVSLYDVGAMYVMYNAADGGNDHYQDRRIMYKMAGAVPGINAAKATRAGAVMDVEEGSALLEEVAVVSDALSLEAAEPAAAPFPEIDVPLRSDYSTTLAFEPFLRSGESGKLEFKVRSSDKLSTFIVQVWAHDRGMRNNVVRKEMTVTIPVKVSVVEPKYLYKGDKYILHGTVSNSSDEPVSGIAALQVCDGPDSKSSKPIHSMTEELTVPAGGSVPVSFEVDPAGCDTVGLKLVFADRDKKFSDGLFVSVPVLAAEQTVTESHSAVLLAGEDKEALLERLRSEFTGTSPLGAVQKEIDIRRMLLDAIPSKAEPEGRDVLALSEAFYVRRAAEALGATLDKTVPDDELSSRIAACQNADGGAAWFEGMKSSPVITAVLLERFAKLRDAGLSTWDFDPVKAVTFLDRSQFLHGDSMPYWCGWLSPQQYAYVRSLYASVPFDVSAQTRSEKSEYSKNLKEFRKYMKDYLTPGKKDGRGLNGQILAKARRIKTLVNLVNNEGGVALAGQWGVRFGAVSKMNASSAADVASLLEYAVDHRDGGKYYPNAVMPWRGLLESELYAHALLADLLSDPRVSPGSPETSRGIRLWMMLQKETQQWDTDPAFVDAVASVLSGGEDVLSTKVVALIKTYSKPFRDIVAAGNGFTVERHFFKAVTGEDNRQGRVEIFPGTILRTGDKVTAEYRIWNQENRSFVKLTAPREAMFRPVDQLSGHYGWWLNPFRVAGVYSITPQGYRNVKSACTEYYFDVYPEEDTVVSEDFFITQDGTFSAPVVTIESLYAPHYRANGSFQGPLKVN